MTSLAKQLQQLALPQSKVTSVSDKTRPSLLFDPKDAATLDKETFYALGKLHTICSFGVCLL